MQKKKLIIIAIVVLAIIAIFGSYKYYQYNYVELLTDYYQLTYTSPIEKRGLFGQIEYTDPKFDFKRLPDYKDGNTAVRHLRSELRSSRSFYLEAYHKAAKRSTKDDVDKMTQMSEITAAKELIDKIDNSTYIVLAFSHPRSYDNEDFLKALKKYGMNMRKLTEFCTEHKLKATYYEVNL